jgi:hypothetical protein
MLSIGTAPPQRILRTFTTLTSYTVVGSESVHGFYPLSTWPRDGLDMLLRRLGIDNRPTFMGHYPRISAIE